MAKIVPNQRMVVDPVNGGASSRGSGADSKTVELTYKQGNDLITAGAAGMQVS